jgi:hypothetical protein
MQSLCSQHVWGKEFEPLFSFPTIFLFLLISTFHFSLLIVSFICTFLQHRTLLLNRWYSCFVSRSFQFAISDWWSAIMTDFFVVFLSPSSQMLRWYPNYVLSYKLWHGSYTLVWKLFVSLEVKMSGVEIRSLLATWQHNHKKTKYTLEYFSVWNAFTLGFVNVYVKISIY